MDIREINSFVVLAQHLHFGQASRLLHLSQPALTKQIHRLEEEIGCRLFERGRGGTALTTAGEIFLEEARQTLESFEHLRAAGQRIAGGERGRLRLGFGLHTSELVPRLIGKLRREAPLVEVSLRDLSSNEQTAALRNHSLDLGFVRLPAAREFECLPVLTDRMALITPTKSNLPARATLADCRDQPFVLISPIRTPTFRQHAVALCAKYGFYPRIVQETYEVLTSLALVRANLGVSLIPQSFWARSLPGVRLNSIPDKEAAWSVGAVWRKGDRNPALKRFLGLLRAEIAR